MQQLHLPLPPLPPPDYTAGAPDRVRKTMATLIGTARAATTMPWDARTLRMWKTVVPQTTRWLPPDEAADLCRQFDAEVARLAA